MPDDLLSLDSPDLLCKWLSKFVLEARKESGDFYPPKTLYSLLFGLYRVSRTNGISFNFLDKKDHRFVSLHSVFSELHSKGVEATTIHAPVVSYEDEQI